MEKTKEFQEADQANRTIAEIMEGYVMPKPYLGEHVFVYRHVGDRDPFLSLVVQVHGASVVARDLASGRTFENLLHVGDPRILGKPTVLDTSDGVFDLTPAAKRWRDVEARFDQLRATVDGEVSKLRSEVKTLTGKLTKYESRSK